MNPAAPCPSSRASDDAQDESARLIASLVSRARDAQRRIEDYSQEQIDLVVSALGWAVVNPDNNRALATLAVEDTGLGNVDDKIIKNHRKTLGLLRDLHGKKTVGVIGEDPRRGIIEIARPVGVVAAVTPSTNPVATVINNIINAVKCRNAVIVAPSPKGAASCARLLEYIYRELDVLRVPHDLVQMLPVPVRREHTRQLMSAADLVIVTGSQANVRAATQSGTPTFGVGVGNVAAIISESADLPAAARKIAESKTFDNATSCSAENSVIILAGRYRPMLDALTEQGGVVLTAQEKARLQQVLWPDGSGKLARDLVGRSAQFLADAAGLSRPACRKAAFFIVEEQGVGERFPFSGEKLSPVLTAYRADDFHQACDRVRALYAWQGAGHSVGLHGTDPAEALAAGLTLPVSRVIVNQAHCFAAGGNFNNGLPFTLTLGCGTWGKNHFSDNLNYRHFFNKVRISTPIEEDIPSLDMLFGDYLRRKQP
ncbi:aldehyde dehydrogenase family protein [Sodalis sp. dw_96]|uniref:acylating sulfoacetaldehyde dehydrogenase n=1 Tax=Sodalis sp. dw_96 TaxID=2719794 RepID=UPI001BD4B02C|nr:aldehyde dehydrogenase family protein [Sodalis sp. dw_96]